MISDYFGFAVGNLFHRRLRSWLTIIGIFIGIAAVVALVSLSQGMQDAIGNIFASLGSDRVLITPKGMTGPPGTETTSSRLYVTDLDVVKKTKGVKEAAGYLSRILPAKFGSQTKYPLVAGLPTDAGLSVFTSLGQFATVEGRMLKSGDKYKVIVGYQLAKETGGTFKKPVTIGKSVYINGYKFEVIGIRKPIGSAMFDTQVIIPLETMREITGIQNELSTINAMANAGASPNALADAIKKDLRKSRGLKEGNEDFDAQTSEQLRQLVSSIIGIIQAVIIGIAAISLLVGGIGIMNTMYTAVLERTNEIGIMKAIGAKNSDVLLIFVIESGMLGLVGGLLGVGTGVALSKTVEFVAYLIWQTPLISANFPWWLILGALGFSFSIGTISGIWPAYQASKMQPVKALRYE